MTLEGKRNRGRPKHRYKDTTETNMELGKSRNRQQCHMEESGRAQIQAETHHQKGKKAVEGGKMRILLL